MFRSTPSIRKVGYPDHRVLVKMDEKKRMAVSHPDPSPLHQHGHTERRNAIQSLRRFVKAIGLLILLCLCAVFVEGHFDSKFTPDFFNQTFRPSALTYEQKALRILEKHPMIDGHNDLAIRIREVYNNHLTDDFHNRFRHGNLSGHIDEPRIKAGRYGGAFWSAFYLCPDNISDFSNEAYDPSMIKCSLEYCSLTILSRPSNP